MNNRYGIEAASDPTTPANNLRQMLTGARVFKDAAIVRAVLQNPACPFDLLVEAVTKEEPDVLFNLSLPLALLEAFDPKHLERLVSMARWCVVYLVQGCPSEVWREVAAPWLTHIALPRPSGVALPNVRRWSRNIRALIEYKYPWPGALNTMALIENTLDGHADPAGAILALGRAVQPRRCKGRLYKQGHLDARLDRLDELLGYPRAPEVHPGVVLVPFGRVATRSKAQRQQREQHVGVLPGLEIAS